VNRFAFIVRSHVGGLYSFAVLFAGVTSERLQQQGKPVPAALVIVCNHPHHFYLESTRSLIGYALDGMGPTDFRAGNKVAIREALRFREKHADMMALWNSIQTHREIPQTFDGQSHHLAFGDHPPRLIVGQIYSVPDQSGAMVDATLKDAVVLPSEQAVYGFYQTATGQSIVCRDTLTEAEAKAYAEQPDTFFGVVKKQTPLKEPMELFDFFFDTYGKSTREVLLNFMSGHPDIESLRNLPQKDLAEIYCESLVYALLQRTSQGPQGSTTPDAQGARRSA
jgi:hypothetical protein